MESTDHNLEELGEEYKKLHPLYSRLVVEVRHALEAKLPATNVDIVSISGRVKAIESVIAKTMRKQYELPLLEMEDLAGVRIVCSYEADLAKIEEVIEGNLMVLARVDKSKELEVDRMGYHGNHYIISLGSGFSGVRYEGITNLRCEIQARTILQDAWATINRQLVYTAEETIPLRLQRDLNNVASLLEIAQGIFDSVREKRKAYLSEIQEKENDPVTFLSQLIDFDTLVAYANWKYPGFEASDSLTLILLRDLKELKSKKYKTLADIDRAVEVAKLAVSAYRYENPKWFASGTDFITKSIGFADGEFALTHGFGAKTREAFKKYKHLVKARPRRIPDGMPTIGRPKREE